MIINHYCYNYSKDQGDSDTSQKSENYESDKHEECKIYENTSETGDVNLNKQLRQKPFWHNVSIFSSKMPTTKITPRKNIPQCPYCKDRLSVEDLESHMLECRKSRFKCEVCGVSLKEAKYLKKHVQKLEEKLRVRILKSCTKLQKMKVNLRKVKL